MAKRIKLTQNKFAIVDDWIFPWISNWNWCFNGYAVRNEYKNKKLKRILMHRQIMRVPPDNFVVDHIDGDPLNNLIENLRICSVSQNISNSGLSSHNSTGFKGVHLLKRTGRFQAQIKANKIRHHIGYFSTAIEAALAYDKL